MLSSNDKSHIKTLYDQYNDMLNYIKTLVDEGNWDALPNSLNDKEKLIKKIMNFEKPRVEDIKQVEYLFAKRKELIQKEIDLIEYIKQVKNTTISDLSGIKKAKKVLNAYEPSTLHTVSTFNYKEEI